MVQKNVELDFEIFIQHVWCGPPRMRVITKALIFDVNAAQWDQALLFLSNLKFGQNYERVLFIHLMQKKNIQQNVFPSFKKYNEYMYDTLKSTITKNVEGAKIMELKDCTGSSQSILLLCPDVN